MNQILTDEEITNITGVGFENTGRAIEQAIINKLSSAEPVAWQNKYLPNSFYTHDNLNPQWGLDDMRPLYEHPPAPSVPEGYQLVPIEPTDAMQKAGGHVNSEWLNDSAPIGENRYGFPMPGVWKAMLAAARSEE